MRMDQAYRADRVPGTGSDNRTVITVVVLAALALATWIYLALGHGRFWSTAVRLPTTSNSDPAGGWPDVTAIVPARDEAEILPTTLPSLLAQDYPGRFRVVVVDDASSDGTGAVARRIGAHVVRGDGPPPGWAGKVAAMAVGVRSAGTPEYLLFTDADVRFPTNALSSLVTAAARHELDLVSQMVRLRTNSRWEQLIIPAFVYFFAQLYPFSRVIHPCSSAAAAAGGCMLVRTEALQGPGVCPVFPMRSSTTWLWAPRQRSPARLSHPARAEQRHPKRATYSHARLWAARRAAAPTPNRNGSRAPLWFTARLRRSRRRRRTGSGRPTRGVGRGRRGRDLRPTLRFYRLSPTAMSGSRTARAGDRR